MGMPTNAGILKLNRLFLDGHERTTKAYRNILYSFLIKGASILSQFVMIPLALHYLDKNIYGIWLTIASIVSWFSFFDIGIGNGLRNKLAETLATGNVSLAKTYVSTSYFLVAGIFFVISILFWIVNPHLNWPSILNAPEALRLELAKVILFVFTFFCFRFVLSLIGNILFAYQQPALNNLMGPLGNILSLVLLYCLSVTTKSSLFLAAAAFSAAPVLVLGLFNFIFFTGRFKEVSPSLKFVHLSYSRNLLGLGFQFFIIQIASLVLFTSSNIIITQLFGPGDVTTYNIAFRYFTVVTMIYGIIMTPFWSAFTEAYVKKEYGWIRKTMRKIVAISYALSLLSVLMLLIAKPVYATWIGSSISIPTKMNVALCFYVIVTLLATPYNTFINGTGKIRLQFFTAIVTTLITVPLAIFLARNLHWGPTGVVIATLFTTLPTMILWRIQYKKLILDRATKIWNK